MTGSESTKDVDEKEENNKAERRHKMKQKQKPAMSLKCSAGSCSTTPTQNNMSVVRFYQIDSPA